MGLLRQRENISVTAVACSPDGSAFLLAVEEWDAIRSSTTRELLVYDLTSNMTKPASVALHCSRIDAAAWSSRNVIAYGGANFLKMFWWHLPMSLDAPLADHDHFWLRDKYNCNTIAFSPDSTWLAAGSLPDSHLYLYYVHTAMYCRKIHLQQSPQFISWFSDGTRIYTGYGIHDVADLCAPPSPASNDVALRRVVNDDRTRTYHLAR